MASPSVGPVVAVTGAAGFIGSRLIPALLAAGVERVVGLDVREPHRRVAGYEHHLVDVAGRDLRPLLTAVDVVVHLAAVSDPIVDDALMTRVNIEGSRRVLAAAGAVGARKVVRVSTAAAYGAWATNAIPMTEDAPLRPNPGFGPAVHAAEIERLLAEWRFDHPAALTTVLRAAPVLGAGADHLWSRLLAGRRRPRIRGEGAPVQVVHVDDLVRAIVLAVVDDHPGVFNIAAPGWLDVDAVRALLPRGAVPAAPLDLVRRALARSWSTGVADVPPTVIPYLVHPWIVATDRLEAIGWHADHTNEETLLETYEAGAADPLPRRCLGAGLVAISGAVALGWMRRRNRRS